MYLSLFLRYYSQQIFPHPHPSQNHNMHHRWPSLGTLAYCIKRIHFHRPDQLPPPYRLHHAWLCGNPL